MRIDAAFTDNDLGILMGFSRITGQKKIQLLLGWLNLVKVCINRVRMLQMLLHHSFTRHIVLLQTIHFLLEFNSQAIVSSLALLHQAHLATVLESHIDQ